MTDDLPELPPEAFLKEDASPDPLFYQQPRFVTHIDDGAIAAVTALTWLGIKVTRWQLHRRATIAASQAKVLVMPRRQQTGPALPRSRR